WNHYELGSPGTAAGDAPPPALYIQGSNVYTFLRGEAGIHRLDSGAGEARERFLARVAILMAPPPLDDPAEMRAALQSAITRPIDSAALDDPDGIVRIYSRGRHRRVRDTRTGLRLTDVEVVLEGDIDAFVLARLRHAAETSTA
ncbi:MAG TPA: hypothetical protein VLA19_07390, partial [Herpetosiphonaceae bacterium]|nr:hypothetical protein [Herpetosiphonaceae bacterium]